MPRYIISYSLSYVFQYLPNDIWIVSVVPSSAFNIYARFIHTIHLRYKNLYWPILFSQSPNWFWKFKNFQFLFLFSRGHSSNISCYLDTYLHHSCVIFYIPRTNWRGSGKFNFLSKYSCQLWAWELVISGQNYATTAGRDPGDEPWRDGPSGGGNRRRTARSFNNGRASCGPRKKQHCRSRHRHGSQCANH